MQIKDEGREGSLERGTESGEEGNKRFDRTGRADWTDLTDTLAGSNQEQANLVLEW